MTIEKYFETDWTLIKEILYQGEWFKVTGLNNDLRCVIVASVFVNYMNIEGVR